MEWVREQERELSSSGCASSRCRDTARRCYCPSHPECTRPKTRGRHHCYQRRTVVPSSSAQWWCWDRTAKSSDGDDVPRDRIVLAMMMMSDEVQDHA